MSEYQTGDYIQFESRHISWVELMVGEIVRPIFTKDFTTQRYAVKMLNGEAIVGEHNQITKLTKEQYFLKLLEGTQWTKI